MSKDLECLEKILGGERMAIDLYQQLLSRVRTQSTHESLQGFLEDHQRHASLLEQRIQELGGEPGGKPLVGYMVQGMMAVKTALHPHEKEILHEIYQGEKQGIHASADLAQDEVDPVSWELIQGILKEDQEHLDQMEDLLHS